MGARGGAGSTDGRGGDSQKPQGGRRGTGDDTDGNTAGGQQK